MNFIDDVIAKAKSASKTIVLPEGEDERVLEAARILTDEKIVRVVLLGNESKIKAKGKNLDGIEIIDPSISDKLNQYADMLYELRKEKGVSKEDALKLARDANYFATLMIKNGDADGMVSGAVHSTADTVRPALQIVKSARKDMNVSSFFFMSKGDEIFVFADCAIALNPTDQELANIAIQAGQTAVQFGIKPDIAMLSYSSYGSGKGESVDKVKRATEMAKADLQKPEYQGLNIKLDGEMQADAALNDVVGRKKAPGSEVAGQANVLIFPCLEAGNIGYKMLQRLCGCEAYGPMLQGLNAPVNDLSRGALVEDIVGVIAITALQAKK